MARSDAIQTQKQPVIEIITKVDAIGSKVEHAGKALQVISGSEAFRKYSWLGKKPLLNSVGDLRGMVINRNWRVVFEHTTTGLDMLGKVTVIAGFAASIAEQSSEIEQIWKSSDPPGIKALQFATIAGTAAERTLAGGVTGLTSLALLSMQGYCQIAGLLGAQRFSASCVSNLRRMNSVIDRTVRTWTDTTKQGEAIIWVASRVNFV